MGDSAIYNGTTTDGSMTKTLEIWSNLLFGLGSITGENFDEEYWHSAALDEKGESGESVDPDDYEWSFGPAAHFSGMNMGVATAGIRQAVNQLAADQILRFAEILDIDRTHFLARWTVDIDKLDAYLEEQDWEISAYVANYHGSYDGFMSFIPMWLEGNKDREFATILMKVDAYLRNELDTEEYAVAILESIEELVHKYAKLTPKAN